MPPTSAPKKPLPTSPAKPKKAKKNSKTEDDDFSEWAKSRQLLKPKDQLDIPEAELKEVLPRVLQTTVTQQPNNIVVFNFGIGEFVPVAFPVNYVVILSQRGTYLPADSDEANRQLTGLPDLSGMPEVEEYHDETIKVDVEGEGEGEDEEEEIEVKEEELEKKPSIEEAEGSIQKERDSIEAAEEQEEGEEGEGGEKAEGEGGDEGKEPRDDDEPESRPAAGKKLTNQFNFCERAALTYNNPSRTRETQTIPPPKANFSTNVLQWVIYDAYLKDFAEQEAEREREREKKEKDKMPVSKGPPQKKISSRAQLSEAVQGRVYDCWKTLERMINQNSYNEIAKDFRYWEDPADEFREEEGTLLPLWKFSYDKTKKNTITDFLWNPHYYDLFAVCFGYLDFMKPIKGGAVCLFTIKNPSFPDYICMTDAGVMCVDIHKKCPYMVLIGLDDGNVMVYNINATCKYPAYKSNSVTQKHSGAVWEVKWAPDMPDGEMNFYSVSSDGKVNNWILMQNEFSVTTVIDLYLDLPPVRGLDGTLVKKKASATCMKLNPDNPNVYLVGTEEGLIYKCSAAYSSAYLLTYKAHNLAVHRIDFNKMKSQFFASCSADWRIKVWEDNRLEPLFVFDLGSSVGDVKWAPYSTTVLGAVTSKGKAYVFDLNINKYKPICEQAIVSRKKFKLTRISFNHKLPIIICGDDKGCTTLLKLSPNLRIPCKAPKKQQHLDQETLQLMKLEKLVSLVQEPNTLTIPPDPAESIES